VRDRDVVALVLPCPPHLLVLPASAVDGIADLDDADGALHDVLALFGLDTASTSRRAVRLAHREAAWLAVGDAIVFRTLASSAFRPLPPWLAGLSARVPVASFVQLGDGFAFELDVERIVTGSAHG